MKTRFIITSKERKYAEGIFDILSDNNEILFTSRMYSGAKLTKENNKGYMPEGEYQIVSIRLTQEAAFTRDGYGWIAGLVPKFQTERYDLALHPDGGFPGSAGCGVNDWTLNESVKAHNLLEEGLQRGSVPFTCLYIPNQQH